METEESDIMSITGFRDVLIKIDGKILVPELINKSEIEVFDKKLSRMVNQLRGRIIKMKLNVEKVI
jgi:hypothetical protein